MAALVKALDTPIQYGKNGHIENGWSSDIQEQLCQLSFQFTRTDDSNIVDLSNKLDALLQRIISTRVEPSIENQIKTINYQTFGKYQELIITAYKMIGHTRDIIDGKGEYTLAYMQIVVWYKFFPGLAKFALRCFVQLDDLHPYGSWKDIKYFCNYCVQCGFTYNHPLIKYALQLINDELKNNSTSLLAKWIPREKSKKFGWIFEQLAVDYFQKYLDTATDNNKKKLAIIKAKMDYRKLISKLNIGLDTVQIKQCDKRWSQIDHSKTTSITMAKQKKAFLNIKENGQQRSTDEDRIQCAKNLTYMIANTSYIKGKRVGLNSFTKEALRLLKYNGLPIEFDLLNSQWRDNAKQTNILGPMIAMVDVSGSMLAENGGNPYYSAIALGCRIAEKSILGKRILTFTSEPMWHNLDMCNNFTEMVESVHNGPVGFSTDFYKALMLILDTIVEKKLTREEVSGLTLVILSDMQINNADNKFNSILYDNIEKMYSDAGIKICGIPYTPPHILFWNLSSTNGFPCMSNKKNVSMMSGFSPTHLNLFCEKGIEGLQNLTPWIALMKSMNNDRYKYLENKIKELINFY